MAEFVFGMELSPYQWQEAARHAEWSYHLNFGGLERQTENYFRQPPGSCPDQSPCAVILRELAAQFRSGKGPVRLSLRSLGKSDRVRLSQLLEQTSARPYREGQDELGRVLRRLWSEFDRQHKVPQDELERAEYAGLERDRREAELARRENARLKRSLTGA